MDLRPELGAGPLTADVWVLGRDYGAEEQRAQQPFVGAAGGLLSGALKFAGLLRESVRIDNLVPKQPRANDFTLHDPCDVAWGQARLSGLLRKHKPKLIVTLGAEVSRFVLGAELMPADAGIQELRGYLWDTVYGRVLTTVHPAGVLRDWTPWRALLNLDIRRAAHEVGRGCPPLDRRTVTSVNAPHDGEELRARCRAGSDWLAVDIENTDDLTLACVGFAPTPQQAWVVPARAGWQQALIREVCESPVPKVLQNGQYDRFFLRRFAGIELRNQVFDTQLAWHALQPELAGKKLQTTARRKTYSRTTVKSLRFLASIYTRDPFWKSYDFASDDERYTLCGRDCGITLDISIKQVRQLS